MKKVLSALIAMTFIPLTTFAISLSTIQSKPQKYIVVSQSKESTVYVDRDSPHSLRAAKPYYSASGKVYIVDYRLNFIMELTQYVNYDYTYSQKSSLEILKKSPNITSENYKQALDRMVKENTGMTANYINMKTYKFDGTFVYSGGDKINRPCYANSSVYHVGNYIFYKCYNEYFQPKYKSENLY